MNILRIFVGSLVGLLAAWLIVLNWSAFWKAHIKKQPAPSWIPLLGGILGAAAIVILPRNALQAWWWLPFILDWGSVPGITHVVAFHLRRRARR